MFGEGEDNKNQLELELQNLNIEREIKEPASKTKKEGNLEGVPSMPKIEKKFKPNEDTFAQFLNSKNGFEIVQDLDYKNKW